MTAGAAPVLMELYEEFGDRVAFLTLYVREAHPGDRYPQPSTFEDKLRHARDYRSRDGIPWPVAVDDVEGSLHRALGSRPNAIYLMDEAGRVLHRDLWAGDARGLRRALRGAVRRPGEIQRERRPRIVPLLRGIGVMDEVLDQAGPTAKRDVRTELPPIYALSRLARLFRPLPPLTSGVLAAAVVGTAALAAVVAVTLLPWIALSRSGSAGR